MGYSLFGRVSFFFLSFFGESFQRYCFWLTGAILSFGLLLGVGASEKMTVCFLLLFWGFCIGKLGGVSGG